MWKWIAFGLGTATLAYISRASLNRLRSHGFYRFWAWEAILGLFLLNMRYWFVNPFAWHQRIAWILLILSLVPLVFGVESLQKRGKPAKVRAGDPSLLSFEKTSQLVTTGIYHYIRHPLYSSLMLLTWGIFFKQPNWISGLLSLNATALLIATAVADEAECIQFFGEPYREYMQHTRRFIPFLV